MPGFRSERKITCAHIFGNDTAFVASKLNWANLRYPNLTKLFIFKFHDDEFTLNALDLLVYCMTQTTTCCPTTGTPALKTCSKTQGLFGETTSSYANHPGIGAKAPIIDYPVIPGVSDIFYCLQGYVPMKFRLLTLAHGLWHAFENQNFRVTVRHFIFSLT